MPAIDTLIIAFAAGAVSFASPCMLPLVPGFAAWSAAATASDAATPATGAPRLGSALRLGLWFVAGFTVIFVGFGALSGSAGRLLEQARDPLQIVGGLTITAMGAFMLADRWLPVRLQQRFGMRERQFAPTRGGAVAFGAVFGAAWSPCIGPTLGAILTLAASTGGAVEGAILLAAFSAGLGVPFLALASGIGGADRLLPSLRRNAGRIRTASGILLVMFGVLLATGSIAALSSRLSRLGGIEV